MIYKAIISKVKGGYMIKIEERLCCGGDFEVWDGIKVRYTTKMGSAGV